jgi:diacylglycerol kinase (ATP)
VNPQWLAIVNPRAGGNENTARLAALIEGLRRYTTNVVVTRYPGHAAELAMQAESHDGVAVAGGDGTLFEILQRINREGRRIALIPVGRGNSLARDLGLVNGRGLLTAMHWEPAQRVDLMEVKSTSAEGEVSRHLAASTVAFGYPAAVVVQARRLARMRRMSYAAAAAITGPAHFDASVGYEGGVLREVRLSGFVANNTRHMANFVAFRHASCCDGRLEVMEMDGGMMRQAAHNLSALSGMRIYEPYGLLQAKSATVRMETAQDLLLDGEIVPGVVSFEVRILPAALECNVPKARA